MNNIESVFKNTPLSLKSGKKYFRQQGEMVGYALYPFKNLKKSVGNRTYIVG